MKKVGHTLISVWHLLINLKNNYLLKKNCWSGPMKNVRILIFTMLYFLKKIKKNTWRYNYFTPVYQKSWWYDLQFLRYRVWQTELRNMGHSLPFYPCPLKTWKIRNFKKWTKLLEISSFYTCLPKTTDILFCNFESFFALLLPPNNLKNQILKNWKKHLKMSSLHTCVPKIMVIWCMLPEIWSTTGRIFGPFFAPLPH